ncbi:MAG: glycosyltransferase family 2 protein [Chlamydiota bacterium]
MHMRQQNNFFIAIIILNWNGKKDTLECLSSLEKLNYTNYKIILVDNGSTDDSVTTIRAQFPNITLIESSENLGFAGGNNLGIEYALKLKPDYIFLLNNDTVTAPDLLDTLVEGSSYADILGAKLYLYSKPDTFDHLGGIWKKETATFDLIANRVVDDRTSWEDPLEIDYACGAALFIKREVIETIGMLEPKFFLIWEESDFCFRAKKAGFTIKLCPQAKVWHKVSASFVGGKVHSTYFWWRGRLLWIHRNCSTSEKWRLFLTVIFPETLHMLKLQIIKTLLLLFSSKSKKEEKRKYLRKQRAALSGIKDYLLNKFGKGPSWIYK